MLKPKDVLVLSDTQIQEKPGGHDKRTLDAVLKYASDHQWTHVVHIGDIVNHDCISSFAATALKSIQGDTLAKDYEVANDWLDMLEQATPGAMKYMIEGNHDFRATKLVECKPQLEGMVETDKCLRIKERGWNWVPYWSKGEVLDIGKASFGHGCYTNRYHTTTHGLRYGRNFYYGHTHDTQAQTFEKDGSYKYEVASMGCLCEYEQGYVQGKPTRWQQAFSIFRFLPNGYYNRYEVKIFNHRFISPEGKEYRG